MRAALACACVLLVCASAECETLQAGAVQSPAGDLKTTLASARKLITDGNAKEAIAQLQALDTSMPEVGQLLGVAYYHADDHQHAIEQLAKVRDKLPEGSTERREAVQVLGLC